MTKPAPPARVAYLGPAGTYTHAAALQWFGEGVHEGMHEKVHEGVQEKVHEGVQEAVQEAVQQKVQWLPVADIPAIFAAVERGDADYGVAPVENSTEGSVIPTLDALNNSTLRIGGEVQLRIHHCLLANEGTALKDIVKIVSHQQSLGQCREWLAANLPGVEKVSVSSNAEAARLAAQQRGVAAIAGKTAAELYGLRVLMENIEDCADNTTRFVVLSRTAATQSTGRDKTSIIISTLNEPGTLFRALEPFHRFGVNLTKLESRPSRKANWCYFFYVDFDGHVDDSKVQQALDVLRSHTLDVKILGSYPAAP